MRSAGSDDLDAGLLPGLLRGYRPPDGPYANRYLGRDCLPGGEGAFVACSFCLTEAFARCGRVAEAVRLTDRLVGLANDVGLCSEEIDPATGAFLGNLPQGLSHPALISAARAIGEAAR